MDSTCTLQYWHVLISGGSYTIYFICLVIDFILTSDVGGAVVGPGALKPTVGDGIKSRRPLLYQFYFLSFFSSFHICICIGVYIIIIITMHVLALC